MERSGTFSWMNGYSIDTAVVLFFLSLELGRGADLFGLDSYLMIATTMIVLFVPYFFPTELEQPSFGSWVAGRSLIAFLGLVLGLGVERGVIVSMRESLKFVPMTGLIIAAMISCYLQFYGLLKLRPAK